MGAYLSEPITEKISTEGENEEFSFGASSMQGWRVSQEDAHNAILNFDTNTSFWAVYDGHGGAEVSAYCALKLPEYLKKLDAYKNGDFEKALKDAFIGFDLTLLESNVIEELKLLARKNPDINPEDSKDEDEDENIADLYQEARMPLRDVLEKYKEKHAALPAELARLQKSEAASKPLSPCLKGRRNDGAGPSISSASGSSSSSSSSSHQNVNGGSAIAGSSSSAAAASSGAISVDDNDATVSSSSSGKCEDSVRDLAENQICNVPDSSSSNNTTTTNATATKSANNTDSVAEVSQSSTSITAKPETVVSDTDTVTNGDVVCGSSEVTGITGKQSEGVSSSSSGAFENGEVSSNTNNEGKLVDSSTETEESEDEVYNATENEETEDADFEEMESEEEDFEEMESEEEDDMLTEEDEEFMNNMADEPGKDSGCTAVVALIRGNELYVANAGDSRCVICRAGETIEMSLDHKPEDQIEFDRIKKAGGRVTADGRVNGGLNLSRAIGDHGYKTNKDLSPEEQMISALPDIRKLTLTPEDEFMVLACDGIWNFMTSEDVVKFVKTKLTENPKIKLTKICEELFDYCMAPNTMGDGTGCDNMTAIVVRFNKNIPVDVGVASSNSKRTADEIAVPDDSPSSVQSASKRVKVADEESELSSSNVSTAVDQAPIIDTSS